jgi:hypothetical protein
MKHFMEPFGICAECYYEKAELRFREEKAEREGALLRLERAPYHICPICKEETYDLDVEVFVEKEVEYFMKNNVESKTIDVGAMFCVNSNTMEKATRTN